MRHQKQGQVKPSPFGASYKQANVAKALNRQDPRALILAPTRELAKQFSLKLNRCNGLRLACSLIVGGENYNDQLKRFAVTLRYRWYRWSCSRPSINKSVYLNGLELLIFDEADRMLI